jgi:hypothetical protein
MAPARDHHHIDDHASIPLRIPYFQRVSTVLLVLCMLGDVAILVVSGRVALAEQPWLNTGASAVVYLGIAHGTALAYILWDLFAKYALSKSKPTAAYEATLRNIGEVRAYKYTLVVMRSVALFGFIYQWAALGWDYAAPSSCQPADCHTLMRIIATNTIAVYVAASTLALAASVMKAYFSQEVISSARVIDVRYGQQAKRIHAE